MYVLTQMCKNIQMNVKLSVSFSFICFHVQTYSSLCIVIRITTWWGLFIRDPNMSERLPKLILWVACNTLIPVAVS